MLTKLLFLGFWGQRVPKMDPNEVFKVLWGTEAWYVFNFWDEVISA